MNKALAVVLLAASTAVACASSSEKADVDPCKLLSSEALSRAGVTEGEYSAGLRERDCQYRDAGGSVVVTVGPVDEQEFESFAADGAFQRLNGDPDVLYRTTSTGGSVVARLGDGEVVFLGAYLLGRTDPERVQILARLAADLRRR